MSWVSPQRGAIASTRPAPLSYQDWIPLPYMLRAVEHLTARMSGGLALEPGMRKTSITLEAFCRLQEQGRVRTMLVVAPLRVCRMVWRQEGAKWTQFRHLRFSLLHGAKKDERLKDAADIYLINPEGVEWLCQKFFGRSLPFDVVTIDELTKFKNSGADRSKALRPRLKNVAWRWGLTGELAPNGYMDLFGQMLMLDDGAALGRYITHYRDQYFSLGYDGFTYELIPGAEHRIVKKIAPYWMQLSADDYLTLPPLIPDPIMLELPKTARATYERMKKDMLATLPEGIVTASNAASTYSKLSQMANGAVYVGDDKKKVALIHHEKLDALETLVESLDGKPLLVAYEFNHDLEAIRERFGADIPYLGKGTTEKEETQWIAAWNRGEIPIFPCHPASAGHGLNLQEGNGAHVCWFGITWDLELWNQFIRRLRRSGNEAERIVNHMLVVRGTIDELKLLALSDKDMTQGRLLKALNTEIRRDAETLAAGGSAVNERRHDMVSKLSRPAAPQGEQAQSTERVQPKGWGKATGQQIDIEERAPVAQTERIQHHLQGGDPAAGAEVARPVFGRAVQSERAALSEGRLGNDADHSNGVRKDQDPTPPGQLQPDPPKPATRRRTAAAEPAGTIGSGDTAGLVAAGFISARVAILAAVIASDPQANVSDITSVSDELWAWAVKV